MVIISVGLIGNFGRQGFTHLIYKSSCYKLSIDPSVWLASNLLKGVGSISFNRLWLLVNHRYLIWV